MNKPTTISIHTPLTQEVLDGLEENEKEYNCISIKGIKFSQQGKILKQYSTSYIRDKTIILIERTFTEEEIEDIFDDIQAGFWVFGRERLFDISPQQTIEEKGKDNECKHRNIKMSDGLSECLDCGEKDY